MGVFSGLGRGEEGLLNGKGSRKEGKGVKGTALEATVVVVQYCDGEREREGRQGRDRHAEC